MGIWVKDLTPLFSFFFSPFNPFASFLSVKATKELLKEGKRETKIPFKFQLYFWILYGYSVEKMSSLAIRKTVVFPKRGVEMY